MIILGLRRERCGGYFDLEWFDLRRRADVSQPCAGLQATVAAEKRLFLPAMAATAFLAR